MKNKNLIVIFLVIIGVLIYSSAYIVDETEQVVITQFGRIIGEPKTSPGLKFKIPFIQNANYFNKNLWTGMAIRVKFPPRIKPLSGWMSLPAGRLWTQLCSFKRSTTVLTPWTKLNDIIDPAVRNFITSHPLIEAVRKSNRELDTREVGLASTMWSPSRYAWA